MLKAESGGDAESGGQNPGRPEPAAEETGHGFRSQGQGGTQQKRQQKGQQQSQAQPYANGENQQSKQSSDPAVQKNSPFVMDICVYGACIFRNMCYNTPWNDPVRRSTE